MRRRRGRVVGVRCPEIRFPARFGHADHSACSCPGWYGLLIVKTSARARPFRIGKDANWWARYGAAILVGWLVFATAHARIIIEISENYAAIEHEASRRISRKAVHGRPAAHRQQRQLLSAHRPRLGAAQRGGARRGRGPGKQAPVRFAGSSLGGTQEVLPGLPRNAILTVSPEQEGASFLRLRVLRHGTRSHESLVATIRFLRESTDRIEAVYRVPTITLRVRPCGVVNAFSSPDITLCTELMDTMHREGWHDAIRVVLYHELAHSLLRLWELPGYDNEDLADEFAVLHAADSPKAIEQISRWFESRNALQKAPRRSRWPAPMRRPPCAQEGARRVDQSDAAQGEVGCALSSLSALGFGGIGGGRGGFEPPTTTRAVAALASPSQCNPRRPQ